MLGELSDCGSGEQTQQGKNFHDEHRARRPSFESAWSIAQTLTIWRSMVLHDSHELHGFKAFHLKWVPHLLPGDLG
jgi:hypothetical protein